MKFTTEYNGKEVDVPVSELAALNTATRVKVKVGDSETFGVMLDVDPARYKVPRIWVPDAIINKAVIEQRGGQPLVVGKGSSTIGALNCFLFSLAEGFPEASPEIEERRAWRILDWGVRVCAPEWLDLDSSLNGQAKALREAEEIRDEASWKRVSPLLAFADQAARQSWEAGSTSAAWASHAVTIVGGAGSSAAAGARGAAGDVWCRTQKVLGTTKDERFVRTTRKLQKMAVELLGRVLEIE